MTATSPAVATHRLTKRFGSLVAVDELELEIPGGSVYGFIGPNGAGKSTTLSILASVMSPSSGWVEVAGANPATDPEAVRRKVGYVPDVLGVYDNLRVDEYLEFFASTYGVPRRERAGLLGGLLELVGLEVKRESMVDSLSRGMKQRLSLARAMVHDPEVLLLDEPASGLDPRARVELRGLLTELQAMGKTVVISSHVLADLDEICTHVAIMEAGRLVADGDPRQIRQRISSGRAIAVRLAGGEERRFTVLDDEEQARLLHRLVVEDGLAVIEFRETGGLEDVFMEITDGTVQ